MRAFAVSLRRVRTDALGCFFMTISWYGDLCIKISSRESGQEKSLVFFPSRKTSRSRSLEEHASIVVEDRQAEESRTAKNRELSEGALFVEHQGEYDRDGFVVRGIDVTHPGGWRPLFLVKSEKISLLHCGFANNAKLSDKELEAIGGSPRIVILPVGGGQFLEPKDAAVIAHQLEPRIVIPICFKTEKSPSFASLDRFVKELGAKKQETVSKATFRAKDLPQEGLSVMVLEEQ